VQEIQVAGKKTEDLRGDKLHTFIKLAREIAYCYKRDTVKIYGNVVKATHGETRTEVLGSGDASQAFQQFPLKQPPLTYVSAPTVEGIASTLQARVNDVEWHETDTLAGLSTNHRNFITLTDDEARTTVVFGNGKQGARLPTGIENIKAVYRSGIGKGGNVKAQQISLPLTKPLGVKEVVNPLRASGGADKEGRDLARRNAPLAVMALDRLVSTQDYADFASTFAGISKASAVRLSDGHRQIVHLTIAGVDDIPIDTYSDLYQNLRRALHEFGDPYQAVQIAVRELMAVTISANVHLLPDYLWEAVEPKIRATLLDKFGFASRDLGQSAFLSEAISAIQKVAGVAYVYVEVFDFINEEKVIKKLEKKNTTQPASGLSGNPLADAENRLVARPGIRVQAARFENGAVKPAQLAFLTPLVPETLILNYQKEAAK
jgi:predicted phage baseplate assembly protein